MTGANAYFAALHWSGPGPSRHFRPRRSMSPSKNSIWPSLGLVGSCLRDGTTRAGLHLTRVMNIMGIRPLMAAMRA